MKKGFLFKVHWFLGVFLGIIIAIIGFTGGMLSFQNEILTLLNKDAIYVEDNSKTRLDPDTLFLKANEAFKNATLNSIAFSSDKTKTLKVNVSEEGLASKHGKNYYMNPYTGEILPNLKGESFFKLMFEWHRWLGGSPSGIGKQIVAIATLSLIALCLSGIYLYFPMLRRKFFDALRIDFKKKGVGFLHRLHAVFGVWSLIFVLLMSFTGLFWSYDWYRNGLFSIAGVEANAMQKRGGNNIEAKTLRVYPQNSGNLSNGQNLKANDAYELFLSVVGEDYSTFVMSPPKDGSYIFSFNYFIKNPQHSRALNQLQLDAETTAIVKHNRYEDKKIGEKFIASIFPLHSGDFFGIVGLTLYCISSFAMVLFAVTGYMLYYKRSLKSKIKVE